MVGPKPARGKSDIVQALARAGISAIPLLGGSAAELFAFVIAPPLEKRRAEWLNSLAEEINRLARVFEDFNVDKLSENEVFVTCIMRATQIAILNHQDEKLEALRNAVLNSVLPEAPEDNLQMMYLHHVDDLTPWHLRILRMFEDPNSWFEQHEMAISINDGGSRSMMLEEAFPELEGRRDYCEILVKDLYSRGLIMTDQIHIGLSSSGVYMGIATEIGKSFLKFITSPIDQT